MATIDSLLSGGDPRSLGKAELVVRLVLQDPSLTGELFECLFVEDETIRMRASDAFEKVCRVSPSLIEPYLDRLLVEGAQVPQASVQWHIAQIIGEVPLTEPQRAEAVRLLQRNLERQTDWIVLNYSLESLARLAREDRSFQEYLVVQLKRLSVSRLKSVSKRAKKLLREFEGPD